VVWNIFTGSGAPRAPERAWEAIPKPPRWRRERPAGTAPTFVPTPMLTDAVNAALHLRRPLLLTGLPGSGKSTLVETIATELQLGKVLRWHVTSKSTLEDGLYGYDSLGRLHASQVERSRAGAPGDDDETARQADNVARFVTLGPLGTALADTERPRALLIDEIDKSDLDLPGDLLDVLERLEFRIPPLVRDASEFPAGRGSADGGPGAAATARTHRVRGYDDAYYDVPNGVVQAAHSPVIVLTSNNERGFPAPFLRRCVRFTMPLPRVDDLVKIVEAHFGPATATREIEEIRKFAARIEDRDPLAVDQLLNLLHLVTGDGELTAKTRENLEEILLQGLTS
jgi:MoxR-like ATPase